MSLRLVLGRLRCRFILRARMLQRSGVTLGSSDALGLRGVPLPRLARLGMVGSLSDVRRSIQITMMCDAARAAHRTTVVAHIQALTADVARPGRIRRIDLEDPTAVGLNHVTGPPVHLATEPPTELHRVLDMAQVLKRDNSVSVPPSRVSNLLSNENTQFLTAIR